MGLTLQVLFWEQKAYDQNGKVIAQRKIALYPDKDVRAWADDYVAFLRENHADLRGSILSEIEANKLTISQLAEIRRAGSADDVRAQSPLLNQAVELSNYLQSIYRMVAISFEGWIHLAKHQAPNGQAAETYSVSFAPDKGEGPLKMRIIAGRAALVDFLSKDLKFRHEKVEAACSELDQNRSASFRDVKLTYYDLIRLGLAS